MKKRYFKSMKTGNEFHDGEFHVYACIEEERIAPHPWPKGERASPHWPKGQNILYKPLPLDEYPYTMVFPNDGKIISGESVAE